MTKKALSLDLETYLVRPGVLGAADKDALGKVLTAVFELGAHAATHARVDWKGSAPR